MDYIAIAKAVIDDELAGIEQVRDSLGEPFNDLVELCLKILRQDGKLVLSGVGKSGHIGRKLAATLASTGSQAVFMNPVDAMHGDLGMLSKRDLLIALSYSGQTEELLAVLPAARNFDIPLVGITGNTESKLAEWSDLVVPMPVPREACPFNLAPTTSTTALLALGDALAIVLLKAHGFEQEDYGKLHPAGAIGRTVTLTVREIMRGLDRAPVVSEDATVQEALIQMTACRAGSILVVDESGALRGIFTDGDFRRHAQNNLDVLSARINTVMTADPVRLEPQQLAVDVLKILNRHHIDDIPVVNPDGTVAGLVDIQDLPSFKFLGSTNE
jgi:arabinose-5-phosphate isomerase